MAYPNRVFISLDEENDGYQYLLMKDWRQDDGSRFNLSDARDLKSALEECDEREVKRRLLDRLLNMRIFALVIGVKTRFLNGFENWELQQALALGLPMIAVNLNGNRTQDEMRCPFILQGALVVHIGFTPRIFQYALEHWPIEFYRLKSQGVKCPRHYEEEVYRRLGQ